MDEAELKKINSWIHGMSAANSEVDFQHLFMYYYNRLTRFVRIYLNSAEDAEEVVSDTFLAVWEKRATTPDMPAFEAALYTIARNKAISRFRSLRTDVDNLDADKVDLFANTETTPEDELISSEKVHEINAAIEALPDKCKEAFKLIREDGMKYKEVAEILNISVKTVEAHVTVALKKLRFLVNC